MRRRPTRSTLLDTPCPYTTLFRSDRLDLERLREGRRQQQGARAAARGEAHRHLVRRFRARDAGVIDLATVDGRDLARQHAAGAGDAGRRSQRDRNEEDPGTAFDRPQLFLVAAVVFRSEEHTSELQSLMRISYAVFCLKKKNKIKTQLHN